MDQSAVLSDIRQAHAQLDQAKVPAVDPQGQPASLAWRVSYLAGQLASARRFGGLVQVNVTRRGSGRANTAWSTER
jgi:hypothetical protein